MTIKLTIFILSLIYAGWHDYKYRIIPDIVPLIIILSTFISNFNLFKSIIGLIFISLPFIIPVFFDYSSVGGGDIKLTGAIGFFLEFKEALIALIIALFIALIFNKFVFKLNDKDVFPLGPYMAMGCLLSLII